MISSEFKDSSIEAESLTGRNYVTYKEGNMETNAFIVGNENLQNELVVHLLQQELGIKCEIINKNVVRKAITKEKQKSSLVLWDCSLINLCNPQVGLEIQIFNKHNQQITVLFNVTRSKGLEAEAIRRGVRCIFYDDISTDLFIKGIESIHFKGDLWYSRNSLIECFVNNYSNTNASNHKNVYLTSRENEVLKMLVSGLPNTKIADELCISNFTVKAHIHNIYKKINVKSRLEAVLWAANNL